MRFAALLGSMLLLFGCKKGDGIVVVTVSASPPLGGIASLQGMAHAGTRTVSFNVPLPSNGGAGTTLPPDQTFGIDIPSSLAGTVTVDLDAVGVTGGTLASAEGSTTVAAGGRADMTLTFGASFGDLAIDPQSGSCGQTAVNTVSATTATFTVTNNGADATGTPSVTTTDPQFTTMGCTDAIPAGGTCTLTVQFKPTTTGPQAATVAVTASPGGSANAMVSGTGLAASTLAFSPASYAFPDPPTVRGNVGPTTMMTLTNNGSIASPTVTLAMTGADAASFALSADSCSGTSLNPGASCTVTVGFNPTVSGALTATIVAKDSSNSGQASATLSGNAAGIWTQEATTVVNGNSLLGVWGPNAGSVYAVGNGGTILHRDANGTWTSQSLGGSSPPNFSGIWGSSASDLWVSSTSGVYRSSGNGTWSADPNVSGNFYGIWGSSATDVYAVGDAGVMHYPGNNVSPWVNVCCGSGNVPLYGIWGSGASDIYAVGQSSSAMLIYHYNGSSWAAQQGNITGVTGFYQLFAAWGSAANDVYIAAESQTVLHSTGNGNWNLVTMQGSARYHAIWGSGPNDVYAVGEVGDYAHWDGKTWTYPAPFTTGYLFGIWGTASNNIYAVGTGPNSTPGAIWHYY